MKKFGAELPDKGGPKRPADAVAGQPAPAPAANTTAPATVGTMASVVDLKEIRAQRPVNNLIPSSGFSPSLVAHYDRGGMVTEQYRVIRTNLMAKFPEHRFCTMITSAEPNEGKTATTLNLGLILAESQDCRTVVVDCDLRKGRVASFLGVKRGPGFVDVVRGQAKLKDVLRSTEYPGLDILTSGQIQPSEIGELLTRPEVPELLNELRQRYNFVLVDTPPVNEISDAAIVGRHVYGALLAVSMFKTHRESVRRAIRMLRAVNIEVLGMILTKQKYYIPRYLYRYS